MYHSWSSLNEGREPACYTFLVVIESLPCNLHVIRGTRETTVVNYSLRNRSLNSLASVQWASWLGTLGHPSLAEETTLVRLLTSGCAKHAAELIRIVMSRSYVARSKARIMRENASNAQLRVSDVVSCDCRCKINTTYAIITVL